MKEKGSASRVVLQDVCFCLCVHVCASMCGGGCQLYWVRKHGEPRWLHYTWSERKCVCACVREREEGETVCFIPVAHGAKMCVSVLRGVPVHTHMVSLSLSFSHTLTHTHTHTHTHSTSNHIKKSNRNADRQTTRALYDALKFMHKHISEAQLHTMRKHARTHTHTHTHIQTEPIRAAPGSRVLGVCVLSRVAHICHPLV